MDGVREWASKLGWEYSLVPIPEKDDPAAEGLSLLYLPEYPVDFYRCMSNVLRYDILGRADRPTLYLDADVKITGPLQDQLPKELPAFCDPYRVSQPTDGLIWLPGITPWMRRLSYEVRDRIRLFAAMRQNGTHTHPIRAGALVGSWMFPRAMLGQPYHMIPNSEVSMLKHRCRDSLALFHQSWRPRREGSYSGRLPSYPFDPDYRWLVMGHVPSGNSLVAHILETLGRGKHPGTHGAPRCILPIVEECVRTLPIRTVEVVCNHDSPSSRVADALSWMRSNYPPSVTVDYDCLVSDPRATVEELAALFYVPPDDPRVAEACGLVKNLQGDSQ